MKSLSKPVVYILFLSITLNIYLAAQLTETKITYNKHINQMTLQKYPLTADTFYSTEKFIESWIKMDKIPAEEIYSLERDLWNESEYNCSYYRFYLLDISGFKKFLNNIYKYILDLRISAAGNQEVSLEPNKLVHLQDYKLALMAINVILQDNGMTDVKNTLSKVEELFYPKYQNKIFWSQTVFLSACQEGNMEVVQILLENGEEFYDRETLRSGAIIGKSTNNKELYLLLKDYDDIPD